MGPRSHAGNRGRQAAGQRLLERDWELAAIERVLTGAQAGVGAFMLIEGDPGSGKSQLLAAGERTAAQAGMRILRARASELEREFSFGLAIQLFEPAWLACDDEERSKLLGGPARRAAVLFDGSIAEAGADRSRHYPIIHGLFWMVCNLVSLATNERAGGPLAILVDDAHWSDGPSMRFLAYLAERIEPLPVAVVLTARQGEPGADPKALARVRRAARSTSLRTRALSAEAVTLIVRRQFPDAEPAFCSACAAVTGGNPFLLVELLDKLRQEEQPPTAAVPGQLAQLLPAKVLDAVAARLDAMPDAARVLAGAVAVLGQATSVAQGAAIAEIEPATAARAADALAAERLLHPGVSLSFVNPLVREAVTATLSPLERAHVHRRAATVLAAEGASAERVAAHLLEAPPAHDQTAIAPLREAAAIALASGQAQRAAALLERALAERPSVELGAELRAELALAQSDALSGEGRYPDAAALLDGELAQPHVGDERLAGELEAAYVSATSLESGGHPRARQARQRMLGALPARPSPRQRRAIAHSLVYESLLGAPRAAVRRLADLAWGEGDLPEDEAAIGFGWPLLCAALLFADELEREVEICDILLTDGRSGRSQVTIADVRCCRAWALYEQGEIAEAAAHAAAALNGPADEPAVCTPLALATIVCCEIERGELAESEAALARLTRSHLPESIRSPLVLELRARLRLSQHRAREALRDALDAGEALRSKFGSVSPGAAPWRSTAALAHLALGQTEAARRLAEAELEEAQRLSLTRIVIRDLRVLGLVAGGQTGIELLERAVATGASYPPRLEHIRALVDLGAALRRANRRADAREPLRHGLALSEKADARVLAARARTELVATNPQRNHEAVTGLALLTVSQRRVAELAGQGLTTRQIAEALFVRPKTVEFHFRQIYRKLDVSSREQLAEALRGVLPGDAQPEDR